MELSFSDANLTTRVELCDISASLRSCSPCRSPRMRNSASRPAATIGRATDADRRSGQASGRPTVLNSRQRPGDRRAVDRSSERSASERSASEQSAIRSTSPTDSDRRLVLSPLGLPPAQRRACRGGNSARCPAWEQKQMPCVGTEADAVMGAQQVPAWEMNNGARCMLDQERDARRSPRRRGRSHYRRPPVVLRAAAVSLLSDVRLRLRRTSVETYVTPPPPEVVPSAATAALPETGFLRLEVEPRQTLQIFVDGLYIGTLADLGDEHRAAPRRAPHRAARSRLSHARSSTRRSFPIARSSIAARSSRCPNAPSTPVHPRHPRHPRHPQAPEAPAGQPNRCT